MNSVLKKIWKVISIILVVIAIFVAAVAIISVVTVNRSDRNIFGYRFYICMSDSMKATDFAAGDLVISKEVDPSEIKEGDIISYVSTNPESNGETITHKVKKVEEENGLYFFTTYGTTTGEEDKIKVQGVNVLGKYVTHIPKVGYFFDFLKTIPGYICCIFIPFAFLIILNIINTVKVFREYKKDEMDKIAGEKKELEEQREETEKMLQELRELKIKLGEKADSEDKAETSVENKEENEES